MGTIEDELREKVRTELSSEKNGVTLNASLVKALVEYLVDVAKIEDVKEIPMGELSETAVEAWKEDNDGGTLPMMHAAKMEVWLGRVEPKITKSNIVSSLHSKAQLGGSGAAGLGLESGV